MRLSSTFFLIMMLLITSYIPPISLVEYEKSDGQIRRIHSSGQISAQDSLNVEEFIIQSNANKDVKKILKQNNLPIINHLEHTDAYLTLISDTQQEIIDRIKKNNGIEIFPNHKIQISGTPNDPEYSSQWGHEKTGVPEIWKHEIGNRSIKIAILDTGVDYDHEDLKSNYLPLGRDFDNNDEDPIDDNGHGTHVAGIIGASINNSIGISGVSNVSIFAEKVLDGDGTGSVFNAAKGIYHAVDVGADVINNSWGTTYNSPFLKAAIDHAIAMGVVVVAASGNDGSEIKNYPAAYEDVIAVGATDINDNIASFSNIGSWLDVVAPGSYIYSTLPGDRYGYKSGTSMATPYIVGGISLLLSQGQDDTSSLTNQLYASSKDLGPIGYDEKFGWGRINFPMLFATNPKISVKMEIPDIQTVNSSSTAVIKVKNQGNMAIENITIDLLKNGLLDEGRQRYISYLPPNHLKSLEIKFDINGAGSYDLTTQVSSPDLESDKTVTKSFEVGTIGIIQANNEENLVGLENYYEDKGYVVTHLSSIPASLMTFEMLFIGEEGSTWNSQELLKVKDYLNSGGSITIVADSNNDNLDWISAYGISFSDTRPVEGTTSIIANHPLTQGVSSMYFEFPSQHLILDNATALVNDTSDLPIIAISNQTNLIVISEDLDLYTSNADNDVFLDNLITHNFHQTDLKLEVETPSFAKADEEVTISLNITNIGSQKISQGHYAIFANGIEIQYDVFGVIDPGDTLIIDHLWTSTTQDIYNITAQISSENDTYLFNNIDLSEISTLPIQNYTVSVTENSWIQLDDSSAIEFDTDDDFLFYELPHYIRFYEKFYSNISIHSNGYILLGHGKLNNFFVLSLNKFDVPVISPFLDDLVIKNNIRIQSFYQHTVIEYLSVKNIKGTDIGSFQTVLWANGTISFNYALHEKSGSVGIISSYEMYKSVIDTSDFQLNSTIKFSPSKILDLSVAVRIQKFNRIGQNTNFTISVLNMGDTSFSNVKLVVSIDKSIIYSKTLTIETDQTKLIHFSVLLQNSTELPVTVEIYSDDILDNNKLERTITPYNGLVGIIAQDNRDQLPLVKQYYEENDFRVDYIYQYSEFRNYDVIFVGASPTILVNTLLNKLINYLYWNGQVVVISDNYIDTFDWMERYGLDLVNQTGISGYSTNIISDPLTNGISSFYFDHSLSVVADKILIADNNNTAVVGRSNSIKLIGVAEDLGIVHALADNSIFLDNLAVRNKPSKDLNIRVTTDHSIIPGKDVIIDLEVRNIGDQKIESVDLNLEFNGSLVDTFNIVNISPGEMYHLEIPIYIPESGHYEIKADIDVSDENSFNNVDSILVATTQDDIFRPTVSGKYTQTQEIGDTTPVKYIIADSDFYEIELYINSTLTKFSTATGNTTLRYDPSDLAIGQYMLTLNVTDSSGLFFTYQTVLTIVPDTTPPKITIEGNLEFEIGSTHNRLKFSVTEFNFDNVSIFISDKLFFNTTKLKGKINLDPLKFGNHKLQFFVYDIYGNSDNELIVIDVFDKTAPVLIEYIRTNNDDKIDYNWSFFDHTPAKYWIVNDEQNISEGLWKNNRSIVAEIDYNNLGDRTELVVSDRANNIFTFNISDDLQNLPSGFSNGRIIVGSLVGVSIIILSVITRYQSQIRQFLSRYLNEWKN